MTFIRDEKETPWGPLAVGDRVRLTHNEFWDGEGVIVHIVEDDCVILCMTSGQSMGARGAFNFPWAKPSHECFTVITRL